MDTASISVVVPTFNRLTLLTRTLQSLFQQTCRPGQIIVVDDGSTDGTHEFLEGLASDGRIRHIRQENGGPARARNAGVAVASGAVIAFIDDDCTASADWVCTIAEEFRKHDASVVGGAVVNASRDRLFSGLSQEITNFFVTAMDRGDGKTVFLTSNNMAFRADALRKVGGFDERFRKAGGEERALVYKILNAGGISRYASRLVVEHHHRLTMSSFLRQQRNYGRGSFILYRVVGRELDLRPERMPAGVYAKLIRSFFRHGVATGCAFAFWFLVAQAMIVIGYTLQSAAPRVLQPRT